VIGKGIREEAGSTQVYKDVTSGWDSHSPHVIDAQAVLNLPEDEVTSNSTVAVGRPRSHSTCSRHALNMDHTVARTYLGVCGGAVQAVMSDDRADRLNDLQLAVGGGNCGEAS